MQWLFICIEMQNLSPVYVTCFTKKSRPCIIKCRENSQYKHSKVGYLNGSHHPSQ
ncbi:hypothetical protein MPQ_0613 [Methylovorus sp. MP688]|nr:hypothetical protein MPQ_0613 [Methylovorus sp. MP688]